MSSPKQELVIYDQLQSQTFKAELQKAIPNTLTPDRMVRLAMTLLRKNAALEKCSPVSIMAGVVECAQLGLELEGVLGHAYLVPFAGEATLIIGYRGFAHLMYQSGSVVDVSAEVVREQDKFARVLGTDRRLVHVPGEIKMRKNGKELVPDDPEEHWLGAYAAAKLISGASTFEYLEKPLIYAARSRSRSWQKHLKDGARSPWAEYPDKLAMWIKTPIRRLAKRLPTSTTDQRANLLRAAIVDEYGERKGLLVPTLGGYQVNENPPDEDENAGADVRPTQEVIEVTPPAAEPGKGGKPRSKKKRGPAESTTSAKPAPGKSGQTGSSGLVPKAQIPRDPIPATPADDPFLSTTEQTDLFNKAINAGWQIDEVRSFIAKQYKVASVKGLRRSQLPAILAKIESGT